MEQRVEQCIKKNATCREKNTVLIPYKHGKSGKRYLGLLSQVATQLPTVLDYHGPFCSNHLGIHGLCRAIETAGNSRVSLRNGRGNEVYCQPVTLSRNTMDVSVGSAGLKVLSTGLDGRHKPYFQVSHKPIEPK